MLSVLLGCIFVISAATGRMTLIGSSQLLVYIGLVLIIFGSFRIASHKRRSRSEQVA